MMNCGKMMLMSPNEIRFTQDTISRRFRNGENINKTIYRLFKKEMSVNELPPIHVSVRNDTYFSRDNRRLYVFRVLNQLQFLSQIKVKRIPHLAIPRDRWSTTNRGCHVKIRSKEPTLPHCKCNGQSLLDLHLNANYFMQLLEDNKENGENDLNTEVPINASRDFQGVLNVAKIIVVNEETAIEGNQHNGMLVEYSDQTKKCLENQSAHMLLNTDKNFGGEMIVTIDVNEVEDNGRDEETYQDKATKRCLAESVTERLHRCGQINIKVRCKRCIEQMRTKWWLLDAYWIKTFRDNSIKTNLNAADNHGGTFYVTTDSYDDTPSVEDSYFLNHRNCRKVLERLHGSKNQNEGNNDQLRRQTQPFIFLVCIEIMRSDLEIERSNHDSSGNLCYTDKPDDEVTRKKDDRKETNKKNTCRKEQLVPLDRETNDPSYMAGVDDANNGCKLFGNMDGTTATRTRKAAKRRTWKTWSFILSLVDIACAIVYVLLLLMFYFATFQSIKESDEWGPLPDDDSATRYLPVLPF